LSVNNDNFIKFSGLTLHISQQKPQMILCKRKVCVHHYLDGKLAMFHGPRNLAVFKANGELIREQKNA